MTTIECRRCRRETDTLKVVSERGRPVLVCPVCAEAMREDHAPPAMVDDAHLAFLLYLLGKGKLDEGVEGREGRGIMHGCHS